MSRTAANKRFFFIVLLVVIVGLLGVLSLHTQRVEPAAADDAVVASAGVDDVLAQRVSSTLSSDKVSYTEVQCPAGPIYSGRISLCTGLENGAPVGINLNFDETGKEFTAKVLRPVS